MDTDAVLAGARRSPSSTSSRTRTCPGSPRLKRWEDVHVLLDAGIDVLTTMNVQHLESLNDQIWQSTGVRVRETIPDWVLKQADEVVMVDLTPRALLNRLARGVVYPPERARAALENFFKESTLVALRELAMRQAAYVVESRLPADESMRSRARRARGAGPPGANAAAPHRPGSVECGADPPGAAEWPITCAPSASRCTCQRTPDLGDLAHDEREAPRAPPQFCAGSANRNADAARATTSPKRS